MPHAHGSLSCPVVFWFRQDLRLSDHPALAAVRDRAVVPLYILAQAEAGTDPDSPRPPLGGALRWWLHHALESLNRSLDGGLVLRRGRVREVLGAVLRETGAGGVCWSASPDPLIQAQDLDLGAHLRAQGFTVDVRPDATLYDPEALRTKTGRPFKVFTPFWRACRAAGAPPLPLPVTRPAALVSARSDRLDDWGLLPRRPDWAAGLRATWQPGETGAHARLTAFLRNGLAGYATRRDFPGDDSGTSRLSPHLRWGEISLRQVWHAVRNRKEAAPADVEKFFSELGWRAFAQHLLCQHPDMPTVPLNPAFARMPWVADDVRFESWCRGLTGYPIVDAGMRELWQTGWMHNRVRMITASFLVKHLLIPWQKGERWFQDTLVDADTANNAAGWQWVAGCGADASPWFRIFNPVLQGARFDPGGTYVRRFVPELRALPDRWIHHPWEAPPPVLTAAGVALGATYPLPVVSHATARQRALAALAVVKESGEKESGGPVNAECRTR